MRDERVKIRMQISITKMKGFEAPIDICELDEARELLSMPDENQITEILREFARSMCGQASYVHRLFLSSEKKGDQE